MSTAAGSIGRPSGPGRETGRRRFAEKYRTLGEDQGDPEWAELINHGSFSVHFDLEEGIKFHLKARDLPEVLAIVRGLRDCGVPLWDAEIGCLVCVSQGLLGYGVPLLDEYFVYCGLVGHMTS